MLTHIPLKQRSAREQEAAGVRLPYFVADLDKPVTYHLKLLLLTPEELDKLVLYARKEARRLNPNPHDNRGDNMEYPPTNRERVDCLRHLCLNRTPGNMNTLAGYSGSFDNLMSRIERKGIDVANRQLELRRQVLALIAQHYPALTKECEYQLFLNETGLKKRRTQ
jgi:hypothetical protein